MSKQINLSKRGMTERRIVHVPSIIDGDNPLVLVIHSNQECIINNEMDMDGKYTRQLVRIVETGF